MLFQDVQRLQAELFHNRLSGFGADPGDQAGTEIPDDAVPRLGDDLGIGLHFKLKAVLGRLPFPLQFQVNGFRGGDMIPHRRKTDQAVASVSASGRLWDRGILRRENQDAVSVFRIFKNGFFIGTAHLITIPVFLRIRFCRCCAGEGSNLPGSRISGFHARQRVQSPPAFPL